MARYMDRNDYANFDDIKNCRNTVNNSTTGQREKGKSKKGHTSKANRIKKRLGIYLTCLVLGGVGGAKAIEVVDNLQDNAIVREEISEFQLNVINKYTERTFDRQNYYYEYGDIAKHIKTKEEDFSKGVYLAYQNLGGSHMDAILGYTEYKTMDNFLQQNNYSDVESWLADEKREIILEHEIKERQEELAAMQSEYGAQILASQNVDGNSLGGQK